MFAEIKKFLKDINSVVFIAYLLFSLILYSLGGTSNSNIT